MSRIQEQDVIALAEGVEDICFEVFSFRGGRLADREDFLVDSMDRDAGLPAARAEFLRRYYSMREHVPPQITVDGEIEDGELLERWLTEKAGRRVRVVQPQKGEQAQLVEMCRNNAAERIARKPAWPDGTPPRWTSWPGCWASPNRPHISKATIFPIPAAATTSPVWWCLKTESP